MLVEKKRTLKKIWLSVRSIMSKFKRNFKVRLLSEATLVHQLISKKNMGRPGIKTATSGLLGEVSTIAPSWVKFYGFFAFLYGSIDM